MDIPFIGTNYKTTIGGILIAVGTGLQYAGQAEIGAILVGVGGILLGKSAPDKTVTAQVIQDVKEQVQEVKVEVQEVKAAGEETAAVVAGTEPTRGLLRR